MNPDPQRDGLSSDPAAAVSVVAALVVVASTAFVAWAVYGSWFFGDDFQFLSDVARGEPDLGWVFQRHNVHFMPLSFLLVMLTALPGAYVWPAAATTIVVAWFLATVACWWMLRTLFGHRLKALVPLVFFCFSPIAMPALTWWAAALNMVMCLPFLFTAITSHVLLVRTGRRRWAVAAVASFVLGLGFYIKVMLLPVVLVLLTLLYFTTGTWPHRLLELVRRWWWAWATYATVGVAYLAAYVARGDSIGRADGEGLGGLGGLAQQQVLGNLAPGLLGGPWRWLTTAAGDPRQLTDSPLAAQAFAVVALAAFVGYAGARYRHALTATWILVPVLGLTLGLLAVGRYATFGAAISREVRYWTDALPYLVLVLGLMTMPLTGATRRLALRPEPLLTWRAPRYLVVALVVVYVGSGAWSSAQYVSTWHDDFSARTYVTNAQTELESRRTPVQLADEQIAADVVPLIHPHNLYSRVLAPIGGFRTSDGGNDLDVLDGAGFVRPGIAASDVVVPDRLLRRCWRSSDGTATVRLGLTTYDFPFWASLRYRIDRTGDARVVAGDATHDVQLVEGTHVLTFRTSGAFDRVEIGLPAGSQLCVDSLTIGQQVVPR